MPRELGRRLRITERLQLAPAIAAYHYVLHPTRSPVSRWRRMSRHQCVEEVYRRAKRPFAVTRTERNIAGPGLAARQWMLCKHSAPLRRRVVHRSW